MVMNFEPLDKDSTFVRIEEYGWKNQTQESLVESYSHCQGWDADCFAAPKLK